MPFTAHQSTTFEKNFSFNKNDSKDFSVQGKISLKRLANLLSPIKSLFLSNLRSKNHSKDLTLLLKTVYSLRGTLFKTQLILKISNI